MLGKNIDLDDLLSKKKSLFIDILRTQFFWEDEELKHLTDKYKNAFHNGPAPGLIQ